MAMVEVLILPTAGGDGNIKSMFVDGDNFEVQANINMLYVYKAGQNGPVAGFPTCTVCGVVKRFNVEPAQQ